MAIRVDAETLQARANELRNYRTTHDENIGKVKSMVQALAEVFEGQTATQYQNNLAEMEPTFTQFSELLEEMATKLDTVAAGFTETDTSLASAISN